MLLDIGAASGNPQQRLSFAVEVLQSSTEYAIIAQDPDGKIVLWNEGARRLYGYQAADVLGTRCDFLYTPDDVAAGLPQTMRETALLSGKWEGVVAGVQANGQRVMAHAVLTPHFDSSGEHAGDLLISRDIGREVTVAQAVEGLLEAAPDAMMIADLNGRILLSNYQTEKLFGYSREELIGMQVEMLVPNAFSAEPCVRPAGDGPERFGLRRDGRQFPAEVSLSPIEADGQRYLISAVRDLTFRKKAEEKFRGLLESAPEAMVIVDREGRIVLVNSQVEKLYGYPRAEMLGKPVEMLIPDRYRENHQDYRADYFHDPRQRPRASGMDLFGLRADGSEFPVEISLSPIETEDGILLSSSIRDVTERKRFEQALQEKNVELANANQALANASEAKDRFLATMSHELRTPLNAILGFTGTLLMKLPGPLLPDQEKHLRTVQANGRHLLSLINDLLDLAKIESGKVEIRREPVVCQGVVEETVAALRPAAEAKGLSIAVAIDPPELSVRADQRSLTQILLNLTSNAIQFTERGGVTIVVGRHRTPDLVEFAVSPETTPFGHGSETQCADTEPRPEGAVQPTLAGADLAAGETELGRSPVVWQPILAAGGLSSPPGGLKGRLQARLPATRSAHIPAAGTASNSAASALAPEEGRDESRPGRQECLRHENGLASNSTALGVRRLVALRVSDTGPGISAEDQAKLFQPFTQVGAGSRSRRQGTGLGLHLSRKLAELLGGDIQLHSQPGQGSTFTLLLEEA